MGEVRHRDMPADSFPMIIRIVDAETDELLWQTVVTGPGAVEVPAVLNRRVVVIVTGADGREVRAEPSA